MNFEELLSKADNGDTDAMWEVAYNFFNGKGIEKNIDESEKWYERLVDAGRDDAALEYVEYLYNGNGFERNLQKSIDILEAIAHKGVPKAQERLAYIYCSLEIGDYKKGLYWRQLAAEQNYPDSVLNLGIMYRLGHGVEKNENKAMELYKSICEYFPRAYYEMAQIYIDKELYEVALEYLQKDSEEICAQYQLGRIYMGGFGIERDMNKAIYWLEKVANENYTRAMVDLGCCYQDNTYGIPNGEKALYWFNRAIENGDYMCYINIGHMYKDEIVFPRNIDMAIKYWTQSAELECVEAQELLGILYRKNEYVPENSELAFYWTNRAASNGSADAQIDVAYDYFEGYGTNVDIERGLEKLIEYANAGNDIAMLKLGCLYRDGKFFEQNIEIAIHWFVEGAKSGNLDAMNCLGEIYGELFLDIPEKSFEFYFKSAELGLPVAQVNVAKCYKNGYGVYKSMDEYQKWLLKAAEQEYDDAYFLLGEMYDQMNNDLEAKFWYEKAVSKNHTYAMCRLALMYLKGKLRNDNNEADKLLLRAKNLGNEWAMETLERLYK